MKKILLSIIVCLSMFLLVSCDKTIAKDSEIVLTLSDEIKNAITYTGEIPYRKFEFEGTFNVYETSSEISVVFTQNDNFKLSDAIAEHLAQYSTRFLVTSETVQLGDKDGQALFGDLKITMDEGTESKEYTIVTWNDDGTRFSYLFRTFVSGGKRYFAYCYHSGINMSMEVPLLVQKVNGEQKIFLISLPYDTKYKIGANTKIKSLQTKEEYTTESYHTFEYPSSFSATENRQNKVKEWYIDYCDGRYEGEQFVFTYLGNDFVVNFNDTNFTIYAK